jgi:hypothetical protein
MVEVRSLLAGFPSITSPPIGERASSDHPSADATALRHVPVAAETKTVIVDPQVGYFGTPLSKNSLVTA